MDATESMEVTEPPIDSNSEGLVRKDCTEQFTTVKKIAKRFWEFNECERSASALRNKKTK